MDNKAIARVFEEMGDILDINGADQFRINAYRRAAITVLNFPKSFRDIIGRDPNAFPKIPGIGEALQKKIFALVQTGHCEEHDALKKSIPAGLLEMLAVRGLGPKKVKSLYGKLGIKSIKELQSAAEKHLIRELEGMGEKTERGILQAIDEYSRFSTKRFLISVAMREAMQVIDYLKECRYVKKAEYAGSLRRSQDTIGDVDILVSVGSVKNNSAIMEHFVSYGEIINVIAKGDTKSAIVLSSGLHVDLRVVEENCFGAALHYFSGNKQHNIRIRDLAKKKGLKVSEYGVFKGQKMIAGKTEDEIFKAVGLPFIIPEIRRDDGEIEYGMRHKSFPKFVELKNIKGDLHVHSNYSDGKNSIEEMTVAMIGKGYEYFAITDHSSIVGITKGMSKNDIHAQWKEIDYLRKKYGKKIKIFKGCEVDILKDGSLDFGDEVLRELDIVIISAHLYQRLPASEQTKRLIAAIESPYANILAHPGGRLINKRVPMEFDMQKVIDACVSNKVALEINSSPTRLDLTDKYVKMAKERGAKFVVNTDSHSINSLDYMEYGVGIARRGWLEKNDVVNTRAFDKFDTIL